VILLGFQIVLFDPDAELNFLDGDDFLILTGFLFPLGLLETELTVVHNLADGGNCLRRNLHKIKAAVVSNLLCVTCGLNPQLRSVGINESYLCIANFFVQLKFFCADGKTPPK